MGLPIFSELNLSPNVLSENFLQICTGKAHLLGLFVCLFVFPPLLEVGLISCYCFKFFLAT